MIETCPYVPPGRGPPICSARSASARSSPPCSSSGPPRAAPPPAAGSSPSARGSSSPLSPARGTIQAATQLDLGFKTSGVVTQIYVSQGAHVTEGQLLAELNPDTAEVTLEQARASLQAAEACSSRRKKPMGKAHLRLGLRPGHRLRRLRRLVHHPGRSHDHRACPHHSDHHTRHPQPHPPPAKHRAPPPRKAPATTPKATLSPALREANIASARAAVKSDRLTVQSAEQALSDTKLFAPITGTIVSLSGEVGEAVSASGTTKRSTSSSGSGSSGSGVELLRRVGLRGLLRGRGASGPQAPVPVRVRAPRARPSPCSATSPRCSSSCRSRSPKSSTCATVSPPPSRSKRSKA